MLTLGEAKTFRKQLLAWFRQFQRDLPWRRTKDPYRIWVSEIMLQQTRVAAVIPYYERFLARFPDVRALADAPQEDVLKLWSGLGYYSRARNLQRAAQQIVARPGGEFPNDEEALLALPGIGRYTAAAILSIAFGAKRAVLDGNVARVLARLGAIRGGLRESRRWLSLQKKAGELLDPKSPGDWNQAMMELGAMVCTPRAPQCLLCPVAKFCRARQLGDPESFPEKPKKREAVRIVLAAAVLATPSGGTLLLPPPRRKTKNKPAADDVATLVSRMWHFPTVAVHKDPLAEIRKFLADALPSTNGALLIEPLARVRHAVTYRNVTVFPFRISVAAIPRLRGARVMLLKDFSTVPVSNLTRKIALSALSEPIAAALARKA
ncbi:MAG: A/G-specific adenine glycosylase [Candidatus Acidiferrum sp.]